MNIIYILMGVAGGMCLAIQGGVNSQLNAVWLQSPILAAAVSFTIGTLALFAVVFALRIPIPTKIKGTGTKWWHWIGGLLGAYLVFATTYLAPIIGAGMLVGLILMGQLSAAVVLDHFGLIGFEKKPINAYRILGVLILAAGVVLIRFF